MNQTFSLKDELSTNKALTYANKALTYETYYPAEKRARTQFFNSIRLRAGAGTLRAAAAALT